jgi:hypothetical protein
MRIRILASVIIHETLFFKTNRPINEKVIDRSTEWTDARNYSSYDFARLLSEREKQRWSVGRRHEIEGEDRTTRTSIIADLDSVEASSNLCRTIVAEVQFRLSKKTR